MSDTLNNTKTVSDILIAWIGVLSLIIGGTWTAHQYLDKKEQQRVQQTLKYVHQFNTGELHKAQRQNTLFWKKNTKYLKSVPDEKLKASVLSLILGGKTDNVEQDIWLIIDFYESISTCVEENICKKDSALAFFGERGLRTYNQHIHYINYVRDPKGMNDGKYAQAFLKFVKSYLATKQKKKDDTQTNLSLNQNSHCQFACFYIHI